MASGVDAAEERLIGRRANARARMCLPVRLVFAETTAACILENLSSGGARIHIDPAPRVGSGAFFECAGIELFCTVSWTQGSKSGLSFDVPIGEDIVVAVRSCADICANTARTGTHRNAKGRADGDGGTGFGD